MSPGFLLDKTLEEEGLSFAAIPEGITRWLQTLGNLEEQVTICLNNVLASDMNKDVLAACERYLWCCLGAIPLPDHARAGKFNTKDLKEAYDGLAELKQILTIWHRVSQTRSRINRASDALFIIRKNFVFLLRQGGLEIKESD